MHELVEIVRRDHARLHDQALASAPALDATVAAHLEFLDTCLAPVVDALGPAARDEWADARDVLVEAQRHGDDRDALLAAVDRHAEQMEQVVLPRLTRELDEETLSDLTAAAVDDHDRRGLPGGRPSAMRAEVSREGPDPSRPAGS